MGNGHPLVRRWDWNGLIFNSILDVREGVSDNKLPSQKWVMSVRPNNIVSQRERTYIIPNPMRE